MLVNKVKPSKIETVRDYLGTLLEREDVPLLGVVPDQQFFASPTVTDYLNVFDADLLAGGDDTRDHHFAEVRLATSSTAHFLRNFRASSPDTLWVAHQTRADLILALASGAAERARRTGKPYPGGLILTGKPNPGYPLGMHPDIVEFVLDSATFPIFYASSSTHDVMNKIGRFTSKLNVQDEVRARKVVEHYSAHVDFDRLLERVETHRTRLAS